VPPQHLEGDVAAHREPHEVGLSNAEAVEEPLHVLRELLQSVGLRGRAGLPVAAGVVAQDAVAALERAHLLVPHREVAGERVAERHDRALALDLVVDVDTVGVEFHGPLSLPSPPRGEGLSVHS